MIPTPTPRGLAAPLAAAIAILMLLAGCEDGSEGAGIGASTTLPVTFQNRTGDAPDIGVGNVHWVGNPRW